LLNWLFKILNFGRIPSLRATWYWISGTQVVHSDHSTYPDKLLRGIPTADCIDSEGRATAQLFRFHPSKDRNNLEEVSINWYDDETAMILLKTQRKENSNAIQFPFGVAIMPRKLLDQAIELPNTRNALSYERNRIEGNPYHGNILQKVGLDKQTVRMFASHLAMYVERIEKPRTQQ